MYELDLTTGNVAQAELNLYQNADQAEDPAVRKKLVDARSDIQVPPSTLESV